MGKWYLFIKLYIIYLFFGDLMYCFIVKSIFLTQILAIGLQGNKVAF